MDVRPTSLSDVFVVEPKVFGDARGFFFESFLVLSDAAEFLYKTTDYWYPEHERCIRWDDPDRAITWPATGHEPTVSAKDAAGKSFRDVELPDALGGVQTT